MISKTAARKLCQMYLDETLTVYLRDMNIVTVNQEQSEVKISPMVEGYVIDIDQDHIHLGLPDGSVLKSIPHSSVGLIEMSFVAQMIDADMPTSDEEVH